MGGTLFTTLPMHFFIVDFFGVVIRLMYVNAAPTTRPSKNVYLLRVRILAIFPALERGKGEVDRGVNNPSEGRSHCATTHVAAQSKKAIMQIQALVSNNSQKPFLTSSAF